MLPTHEKYVAIQIGRRAPMGQDEGRGPDLDLAPLPLLSRKQAPGKVPTSPSLQEAGPFCLVNQSLWIYMSIQYGQGLSAPCLRVFLAQSWVGVPPTQLTIDGHIDVAQFSAKDARDYVVLPMPDDGFVHARWRKLEDHGLQVGQHLAINEQSAAFGSTSVLILLTLLLSFLLCILGSRSWILALCTPQCFSDVSGGAILLMILRVAELRRVRERLSDWRCTVDVLTDLMRMVG